MERDNRELSRFEKLLNERTELLSQASALEPSAGRVRPGSDNDLFIGKQDATERSSLNKRPRPDPDDNVPCTCEVSSRCQRAAKNGIQDCRTLVAPKRNRLIKPRE